MHGEKLIVEIGPDQPAFRPRKLKSHGHRGEPAEEQENESRDDVAPADDLVIDGRERADEAFRRAPCLGEPRRQLADRRTGDPAALADQAPQMLRSFQTSPDNAPAH